MTSEHTEQDYEVEVDRVACEGHALCLVYAPDVFEIDDEERAVLLVEQVPEQLRPGVEEAATNCPVQAILIRHATA